MSPKPLKKLTATDRQTDRHDHILSQADALTKNHMNSHYFSFPPVPTPCPHIFLVRASAWLNTWSCPSVLLSACPFQLASESSRNVVARRRFDYRPRGAIFIFDLYFWMILTTVGKTRLLCWDKRSQLSVEFWSLNSYKEFDWIINE